MPNSVIGTMYVVVDNHGCFVAYNDHTEKYDYAFVSSTGVFPPKRHRYETREEAEEHIVYLDRLVGVELENKIEHLKEYPHLASPQSVIDELSTRHFRVATITIE